MTSRRPSPLSNVGGGRRRTAAACVLSALALALLTLAPTPGLGQPAGAPAAPDDAIARAQALYDRATQLFEQRNYADAIVFFERALELVKEPDIEYNIAKSYEKIANYDQAVRHFEGYLALYRQKHGTEAPDTQDVEAIIRDLKRRAAPKPVMLTVQTEPPGANVYLGSRESMVGQTPFEQELDPGSYALFVLMDGYEDEIHDIVIERDTPRSFSFKLRRRANTGALTFDVNVRGARIYVGGQVKGLTPYEEEIVVPAGRRQVTIEKDRYGQIDRYVDVRPNETIVIREDLFLVDPPYSWRGYLGWVSVGLGIVGVGAGVTIKLLADGEFFGDEAYYQDLSLYQALAYGIGGGLLGAGVGLVIWEYARDAVEPADLIERGAPVTPPPVAVFPLPGGGVSVSSQFRF